MSDNKDDYLPTHLGIILDGNRRWAKERGLSPMEGHKKGFETFKTISDECLNKGIKFLSVYAFSTENWKRSIEEVGFLMRFVDMVIDKHIKELNKKNVRFIWLGSSDGLDNKLVKKLKAAQDSSKDNTKATFCLCFNYGGHQEIVDAANSLIDSGMEINTESLATSLYGGAEIPDVDMIIRTSGEERISNFMLWRAAYSELYFTNVLWPDFSTQDLNNALETYASRQRRFGN